MGLYSSLIHHSDFTIICDLVHKNFMNLQKEANACMGLKPHMHIHGLAKNTKNQVHFMLMHVLISLIILAHATPMKKENLWNLHINKYKTMTWLPLCVFSIVHFSFKWNFTILFLPVQIASLYAYFSQSLNRLHLLNLIACLCVEQLPIR